MNKNNYDFNSDNINPYSNTNIVKLTDSNNIIKTALERIIYAFNKTNFNIMETKIIDYVKNYKNNYLHSYKNYQEYERDLLNKLNEDTKIYDKFYTYPLEAVEYLKENITDDNTRLQILDILNNSVFKTKRYDDWNEAILILENKIKEIENRIFKRIIENY